MQALLAAVRKACLPGLWSQGVALARDGAVIGAERRGDTVTARVRQAGRPVAPTVVLYPDDTEWTCDCGGKIDPCAHVAAAAILLAQAPPIESAASVPAPSPSMAAASEAPASGPAHVRYRLERASGALALKRTVVHEGGREEPLRSSLAAARAKIAALAPTHEDLSVDRYVGAKQYGYFPPDRLVEIFGALAGARDVLLDGKSIKTSGETIAPRGLIEDAEAGGVTLTIAGDPRVEEIVVAGVVRLGDTLHAIREVDLTGPRLEKLPFRRGFARGDLGRLVTEVLPGLEKRITVETRTRRLPKGQGRARPRIVLTLEQKGHTLSVVPALVYGDPVEAKLVDGRLVHIGGRVPTRDESAERGLLQKLRDELHLVPGRRVDFDGADAIRFAQRLDAWDGGGESRRELFGKLPLVPRFVIQDRTFDVVFEVDDGSDPDPGGPPPKRADAAAVIRAYQDGLPLVPLEGGGWAPLPHDWLSRYGDRVADLLAARRDEDKEVPTAALPALADLCDALQYPRPAAFEKLAPLIEGFESLPEAPLPADLTAELRPYQRRGVSWLVFLREAGLGAVLADDMGLGKTLQTLCAVAGRTLVVCPRSVVHNWADEIRRFRPALRSAIYHGPRRALDRTADVTLTTYAVLRLDAEILAKEAWDTVVLDEAQAIKNPDSQVARAAYDLRAGLRVALSGTPVENRLDELWSLLHFTNRGVLGGLRTFQERWSRPIDAGVPGVAAGLRAKIRPFVLRRLKKDVVPELPPRADAVLYCELEESERNVYEAVRAAARKDVVARLAEGSSVLAALEALLRLRQAACHPALIPGQTALTSSKVERLIETLESAAADGHKALVFSQWTSLLDLIEPHLKEVGIAFTRLDGSTRDRGAVVADFQREAGPPVMLISLKAGGTGLNLTAADHVFLLDPWWNPAVEDQAEGRAHRIGQERPVMVYRLVAKDTVEEGILALQQRKRNLAEAALGEADQAGGITREDLLALLQ